MLPQVLYLSSTQFSGTTLLSFILNCHSEIATVGHTTGWRHADSSEFRCSCGNRISDCAVFGQIGEAYRAGGLSFEEGDFGTAFRVTRSRTLNYYLTEALPGVSSTPLERFRDLVVSSLPAWRNSLQRQMHANVVFMSAALESLRASVYLDNSHSPFRLRTMTRIPGLPVKNLHLVRDPRGVALSLMTNSGYTIEQATRAWLRRQRDILRIASAIESLSIRYEDLCTDPNTELARIHAFAGLAFEPFCGDFMATEHHILGNRMRLGTGEVRLDERWRRDLGDADRHALEGILLRFAERNGAEPVAPIIESYLSPAPA